MAILENYTPHRTIKLYTSIFGTLFDKLQIVREDGKIIKIPLSYAAQQKYNVLTNQSGGPRTPRLSFILTGWEKDMTRITNKMFKLTNHHAINRDTATSVNAQYNRTPYNFNFELHATTKYVDDLMQIVEQIVVNFNPSIQVIVKDNPDILGESAINITLNDSQMSDSFEGSFEDDRDITAVFNFTLEGYLYTQTSDSSIIRRIELNYYDLHNPDEIIDQTILTEADAPNDE